MRVPFTSRPARLSAIAIAAVIGWGTLPALGAEPAPTAEQLQQQIQQLQRDVDRLQRANQAIEPMVDEKITKQYVTSGFNLKDGFFIQDPTKEYRLRFGGYTQLDGRFFISDNARQNNDQFLFRRVRPVMEGNLTKFVDFRIMPDFAGSSVQLFDAYVDLKPFDYYRDWLKLRVGKYKAPVGLERLQSATAISLVERGQATNLVPTRDVGLMLWGTPWSSTILYELGVFDGAPDGGNINGNIGDDFTFSGRVFAQPFVTWPAGSLDPLRGLGFGVGGSYGTMQGSATNTELPSYRTFGQAVIFQYVTGEDAATTPFSKGTLTRINPQLYWYWGPFSALFEYVRSSTPVQLGDTNANVANTAWTFNMGWVLTGEDSGWRGVTPAKPFNPWIGNWGAVEVVGRFDQLNIDPNAFELGFADPKRSVQQDQGFGGSINWYWNKNIKIALDYYRTWFEGGASSPTSNRQSENVIIGRLQLVL